MHYGTKIARAIALVTVLAVSMSGSASAQDIQVWLSVKMIRSSSGQAPSGVYGDPANIIAVVDQANEALRRFARGYEYQVIEILDVYNQSQYWDVADEAEYTSFLAAAKSDSAFRWNSNAVNVYIVDSAYAAVGGELVMLLGNLIDVSWIHELGHHFGLAHTFDPDDGVDDTVPAPDVKQCTVPFGCSHGGTDECCCATKEQDLALAAVMNNWTQQQVDDIRFNSMSYFGARDCDPLLTFDNTRLTPGQLDLWTDTSRLSFAHEVSGLTRFVNSTATSPYNGLSTDPYRTLSAGLQAADPSGGDIVLMNVGSYSETLVIEQPVVLRSSRGSAIIGT